MVSKCHYFAAVSFLQRTLTALAGAVPLPHESTDLHFIRSRHCDADAIAADTLNCTVTASPSYKAVTGHRGRSDQHLQVRDHWAHGLRVERFPTQALCGMRRMLTLVSLAQAQGTT